VSCPKREQAEIETGERRFPLAFFFGADDFAGEAVELVELQSGLIHALYGVAGERVEQRHISLAEHHAAVLVDEAMDHEQDGLVEIGWLSQALPLSWRRFLVIFPGV